MKTILKLFAAIAAGPVVVFSLVTLGSGVGSFLDWYSRTMAEAFPILGEEVPGGISPGNEIVHVMALALSVLFAGAFIASRFSESAKAKRHRKRALEVLRHVKDELLSRRG